MMTPRRSIAALAAELEEAILAVITLEVVVVVPPQAEVSTVVVVPAEEVATVVVAPAEVATAAVVVETAEEATVEVAVAAAVVASLKASVDADDPIIPFLMRLLIL